MKLLALSDSHGAAGRLQAILQRETEVDGIVHLGDGAGDMARFLAFTVGKPVWIARGNCDRAADGLAEQHVFTEAGVTVLACHGHRYNVKTGLLALYFAAVQAQAKLCLYGHTHVQKAETYEGVTLLNPGAVMNGRYAVVTLENGAVTYALKSL